MGARQPEQLVRRSSAVIQGAPNNPKVTIEMMMSPRAMEMALMGPNLGPGSPISRRASSLDV